MAGSCKDTPNQTVLHVYHIWAPTPHAHYCHSSKITSLNLASLQTAEWNFQFAVSAAKHDYENGLINQFSTNWNSSIYKYLSFLTNYSSFLTTMH